MCNLTLGHYMLFLIFKDAYYLLNIIAQTYIILTAYSLCFSHQTMECWREKMHKSITINRFIPWSFITIIPVITSTLLFISQMSQSYLFFHLLLFSP